MQYFSKKLFIIIVLNFVTIFANAQNRSLLTKTGDLTYCMDSSEFMIGSFYYSQPKQEVLELLGSPDSTWINEGPSETYFFQNLRIEFNRIGKIYFISTNSKVYRTPSGIHVGQTRDEIFRILGLKPNELPSIKFENQFVNCSYEVYFILVFDQSLVLNGLEIGIDLP